MTSNNMATNCTYFTGAQIVRGFSTLTPNKEVVMETPVSQHYDYDSLCDGVGYWYIHCPTCDVAMFVIYPRIRVIRCPKCGVEFIEGGVS